MPFAVLFPGQGSQTVGMGSDVFGAYPELLGQAADDVLGWALADLVSNGPEEALTATDKAQPALFAVSYVLWRAFSEAAPPPAAAAGHSLGEYTALAAAGVLAYPDGLQLVSMRGTAMAAAGASFGGGMAALLGSDRETAEAIAQQRTDSGGQLWVANINAPGQIVMTGATEDISWLVDNARDLGVRRAIALNVAGAFHSPLMAPAAADLANAIEDTTFAPADFPVYGNVTARPIDDAGPLLLSQLTSPVLFSDSLLAMAASGIDTFVHVGPGDVTAGLVKRTVDDATIHVVNSIESAREVAQAVS